MFEIRLDSSGEIPQISQAVLNQLMSGLEKPEVATNQSTSSTCKIASWAFNLFFHIFIIIKSLSSIKRDISIKVSRNIVLLQQNVCFFYCVTQNDISMMYRIYQAQFLGPIWEN